MGNKENEKRNNMAMFASSLLREEVNYKLTLLFVFINSFDNSPTNTIYYGTIKFNKFRELKK